MGFSRIKLGEIVDVKGGKRLPKGHDFIDQVTSHPYIRARDVRDGKITFDDPVYVSEETHSKISRYTVNTGDVCITIVGANVGDVGQVPLSLDGANLTENTVKLISSNDDYISGYVKYALLMEDSQKQMKNFAAGAAQPKLGIYKIKEVEIPYPEYLVRQEIDGILDKYDNLIENNNRRIAILEDMSQSLYREWFVKFRFPSYEKVKFKGSPLGQIPEGWEVKAIQDFGEVITGKTPSKKKPEYYSSPDVAFLKTPDMHGSMFATDIVDYMSKEGADSQKKKYIPKNSICVACIGAKAGVVAITPFEVQTNQQINAVVLFEEYFREYLYLFAVSLHEKIHAIGSSGATMTNVSKGKFESIEVAFPEVELLRSFSQAVAPIFDEILNLQKKNTNLKKQRDMLLPKLISGKINL